MKAPRKWSEVTISQYYNLCEAISMDWADDTDRAIAMLSALSGISIRALNEDYPVTTLKKYINHISFIGSKTDGTPRPVLWVGKRKFHFDLMIKESAASSFISHADATKDAETTKMNIHRIMAIYCYEVNWFGFRKKRTASSQKEIAEYFKENMTMDKAFIYSSFFLKSWENLSKATLSYSIKTNQAGMRKMNRKLKRVL